MMAYSVAQRTSEIGVRIALGATPADLVRTIVREASALIAIGLVLGLTGALILTRVLEKQLLPSVETSDPAAFIAVTLILGAAALLASLIPAWRGAHVDPLHALRSE